MTLYRNLMLWLCQTLSSLAIATAAVANRMRVSVVEPLVELLYNTLMAWTTPSSIMNFHIICHTLHARHVKSLLKVYEVVNSLGC